MTHIDRKTGRAYEPDKVDGYTFIAWKDAVIRHLINDAGMSVRETFYAMADMRRVGLGANDCWLDATAPDDWACLCTEHMMLERKPMTTINQLLAGSGLILHDDLKLTNECDGDIPFTLFDLIQAALPGFIAPTDEVERVAALIFDHDHGGTDEFGRPTEEACHDIARKILGIKSSAPPTESSYVMEADDPAQQAIPPRPAGSPAPPKPIIPDPSRPWREMTAVEQSVDALRQRVDAGNRDLDKTEARFNGHVSALDERMSNVEGGLSHLLNRVDELSNKLAAVARDMYDRDDKAGVRMDGISNRVTTLERKAN